MHALAEGDFEKAEAAAKLAQDLIQNSDLETLIQKLAAEKNKQSLLFK
jgi:HemY protein